MNKRCLGQIVCTNVRFQDGLEYFFQLFEEEEDMIRATKDISRSTNHWIDSYIVWVVLKMLEFQLGPSPDLEEMVSRVRTGASKNTTFFREVPGRFFL